MSTQVTFVNKQEAKLYECGICLEMLKDPVAVCDDDHTFCEQCIAELILRERPYFKCPNCKTMCSVEHCDGNKFIQQRMAELITKCPNFEITAEKASYMKRSRVRIHRKHNDSNSNQRQRRRSRSRSRERKQDNGKNHDKEDKKEKQDQTALCEWTGPWSNLQKHIAQCPLQIIKCCYCDQKMPRGVHSRHCRKSCTEFALMCEYKQYGCNQIIKRKNKEKHRRDAMAKHLQLIKKSHNELEGKVEELESQIVEVGDLEETIDELRGSIEEIKEEHADRVDELEARLQMLTDTLIP